MEVCEIAYVENANDTGFQYNLLMDVSENGHNASHERSDAIVDLTSPNGVENPVDNPGSSRSSSITATQQCSSLDHDIISIDEEQGNLMIT